MKPTDALGELLIKGEPEFQLSVDVDSTGGRGQCDRP